MATDRTSVTATVRLALTLVWSAGRRELIWSLAASLVAALALAGELLAGRQILDLLTSDDATTGELVPWLIVLGALLVISALANTTISQLRLLLSDLVERRATDEILDVATAVELEAFEGPGFHDRLERTQRDVGEQAWAVVWGLVSMITTLTAGLSVMAVLLTVAPVLVPVAAIGYVPTALVHLRNNRALRALEVDLTELDRDRSYHARLLTERTTAAEVRAYGLATHLRGVHTRMWARRISAVRRLVARRLVLSLAGATVTAAALVVALGVVLALAVDGQLSVGDAAVAIVGLQQLNSRLQYLGTALSTTHEGVTFLRDLEEFRALAPTETDRQTRTAHPPRRPDRIALRQLTYRYPGAHEDALSDVDIDFARGQVVAVVGANGSGKSTLAKLLAGLLAPTSGTITWDGVDLAGCDPERVRAQVATVFQDHARFELAARDAIALGDVDRIDDLDAIRAAAVDAGALELLEGLEHGVDTRLGKAFSGGTDLSGGQWQRLAIARAFFRDAPIVLLDEPSAWLDPQGEADLFDRIARLCTDRIVVFVSHRFATVRTADVVVVLDEGRVAEAGSHHELMARGGLYADLFRLHAERSGLAD